MSKAIELAEHYENKAKKFQPTGHARFRLNELTAELRRLAAVEQELADLKAAMGEPVAQIISANDETGAVEWLVHSGRPIRVGQKLYATTRPGAGK